MEEQTHRTEKGQSIVIIAIALIVLLIFAVVAVDLAYGYVHRRGDQNAADASALAGARELAGILNDHEGTIPGGLFADGIKLRMNDFAERNGIEDTGGGPGDTVNENVDGYWLDETGERIMDPATGNAIEINEGGFIHPDARGVEAIAHSVAPSFFGGFVGLDGLPIQAESAVVFNGDVCSMNCIAPIATYTMTFQYAPHCYNIWDGSRQMSGGGGSACEGICQADNTCSNDPTATCQNDNQCNFGDCEDGFCEQNANIPCTPSGDVCSNDTSLSCLNDNKCNFGDCINNACEENGGVFCTSDADCAGTCGPLPAGWYCSGSGTPCTGDADCPEGEYCEDEAGGSSSGLGWLNWSLNAGGTSCKDVGEGSDCSETCLEYNFVPGTCLSGDVEVGEWVAGGSGVKNSGSVRSWLEWYIDEEEPMTVIVYDVFTGSGCNQDQNPNKLKYHVVGFAKFKVLGYQLSQGSGSGYGHDGSGCEDWGMEGNRITGEFLGWVEGNPGDCDPAGTIIAPVVVK